MIKWLIICLILTGCAQAPVQIKNTDFMVHIRLIDEFYYNKKASISEATVWWRKNEKLPLQCTIVMIKSEYPRCFQHGLRHCVEGQWHTEKYNNDDCFY